MNLHDQSQVISLEKKHGQPPDKQRLLPIHIIYHKNTANVVYFGDLLPFAASDASRLRVSMNPFLYLLSDLPTVAQSVSSGWSLKAESLYHASDLMMRHIMSSTITNVRLWFPIVLSNWVFLDSSPIATGAPHLLTSCH